MEVEEEKWIPWPSLVNGEREGRTLLNQTNGKKKQNKKSNNKTNFLKIIKKAPNRTVKIIIKKNTTQHQKPRLRFHKLSLRFFFQVML